jgi:outer membrane protein TolC
MFIFVLKILIKMNRKLNLVFALALASSVAFGQISIEDCYEKARANYPTVKRYDLIEQAREYNLLNVSKAWLPQVALSAKASYQSEVTKIPIDFSQVPIPQLSAMEIPELSKDQYGATLEISQTLWDGGATSAKRQVINAKSDVEKQEVEVSLYALRERVNQLFFGILLCDAMMEQNRLFQSELQNNYERVSNLINGGLANQADLDAVRVEQLKARQGETQIAHSRKAYLDMLAAFIGDKLDDGVKLLKPDGLNLTGLPQNPTGLPQNLTGLQDLLGLESASVIANEVKQSQPQSSVIANEVKQSSTTNLNKVPNLVKVDAPPSGDSLRPELSLFDASIASIDAARRELNAALMPRLGLFLTGGYGNPGLNMLKNEFSPYYIGGVRLSWNFGGFYTRKNSLRLLETNRNSIEVQRETFLFNTALNQSGKENEIAKYRDLLRTDEEIVALRTSIRRAAETRLENGTVTAIDLMHEANAEQSARQDKIVHEIELLQAIYNLKFILNQ